MRNISRGELAVLMGAMAIGTASAEDECEMTGQICQTTLATVYVQGSYHAPTIPMGWYYNLGGDLFTSGTFPTTPATDTVPLPSSSKREKIKRCIDAYGQYRIPSNVSVNYRGFYTWKRNGQRMSSIIINPNWISSGWLKVSGTTRTTSPPEINIYAHVFNSTQELFVTVAHEAAHANGVTSETTAESSAISAYTSYYRDRGARCGGLIQ